MAEKKTTKKKATTKKTKNTVLYNEKEYEVLEQTEDKVKLTDGSIHFWVRAKDVSA